MWEEELIRRTKTRDARHRPSELNCCDKYGAAAAARLWPEPLAPADFHFAFRKWRSHARGPSSKCRVLGRERALGWFDPCLRVP
jgi:hypothetical protein